MDASAISYPARLLRVESKLGQVMHALGASVSSTADTKMKWANIHEAFGTVASV